ARSTREVALAQQLGTPLVPERRAKPSAALAFEFPGAGGHRFLRLQTHQDTNLRWAALTFENVQVITVHESLQRRQVEAALRCLGPKAVRAPAQIEMVAVGETDFGWLIVPE